MKLSNITKHKYFRFGVAIFAYLLFVIWLNNYWFLLGVPVIFDMYVSKKVNWSFWKSRKKKNNVIVEWLDALIFAVVSSCFRITRFPPLPWKALCLWVTTSM